MLYRWGISISPYFRAKLHKIFGLCNIKVGISNNPVIDSTHSHTTPYFMGYGRAEFQQNAVLSAGVKGSNFAM